MFKIKPILLFIISFAGLLANDSSKNLNSDGWKRIYLASFISAGNHWMRYVIEEATHVATSAVYQESEHNHSKEAFPWGGYCVANGFFGNCRYPTQNDPVVIKTHFPLCPEMPFDNQNSILNVRIVRNPIDTCWSFFTSHFPEKNYPDKVSHNFVVSFIQDWRKFQEHWTNNKNCLTVRYEDMLQKPSKVFKEVLKAMGLDVNDEDIRRAILKWPPKNSELQHIKHFEQSDIELMKKELQDLLIQFKYVLPD